MKPVAILILTLLLGGCAAINPVLPVSDGFHDTLPDKNARLVVWGNHLGAVDTATTWLQKRGYRVVERAQLNQILLEQHITITHTAEDHTRLLQAGKLLGAQQVIFLETNLSKQQVEETNGTGEDGKASNYALYNLVVSLRGVDCESGEIQWSGKAYYPGGINNPSEGMSHLTRSALAKAWG